MPPPPPPELVGDVIVEILLRLPPDEPEYLFRAALVCRPWLRTLSDPAFLRRYRAFHGTPPLLGVVVGNQVVYGGRRSLWFIPTTAARAFPLAGGRQLEPDADARARDCRHGRLLIRMLGVRSATASRCGYWLVCDLVTGDRHRVPDPWIGETPMFNAAAAEVFCAAAAGCQHLGCHGAAFRVAILFNDYSGGGTVLAAVYSSENGGAWSAPATLQGGVRESYGRAAIIADEIYFMLSGNTGIARYNWGEKNCLSVIKAPPLAVKHHGLALMVVEGSSLGVAGIEHSGLNLWSRRVSSEATVEEWVLWRVIHLDTTMPMVNPSAGASVVGFAEGLDAVFVGTHVGLFMMELKSGRVRKLSGHKFYLDVLPCMSFYTPDRCRVIRSLQGSRPPDL